jgi:hypothetical protein
VSLDHKVVVNVDVRAPDDDNVSMGVPTRVVCMSGMQ